MGTPENVEQTPSKGLIFQVCTTQVGWIRGAVGRQTRLKLSQQSTTDVTRNRIPEKCAESVRSPREDVRGRS